MKNLPKISEAEYEVMKVVWEGAPISTNDVSLKLSNSTQWSPKTIQTLLSRLVKKGALSYVKEGRTFVYSPLVLSEEYLAEESESFLKRFYHGALNSMVLNFLEQDRLTGDDINELKSLLEQKQRKDGHS